MKTRLCLLFLFLSLFALVSGAHAQDVQITGEASVIPESGVVVAECSTSLSETDDYYEGVDAKCSLSTPANGTMSCDGGITDDSYCGLSPDASPGTYTVTNTNYLLFYTDYDDCDDDYPYIDSFDFVEGDYTTSCSNSTQFHIVSRHIVDAGPARTCTFIGVGIPSAPTLAVQI